MRLFGRQAIDEWRDGWTLIAAKGLNDVAADMVNYAEFAVATASARDLFVAPGSFIANRIAPRVRTVTEPVVADLFELANMELSDLDHRRAVWSRQTEAPVSEVGRLNGIGDLALAAAPLASGVAVMAALPAAAVTTTAAWFGLVATTTVSWPVVLAGGAVAGTALLTGVHNSARLRGKFEDRLRARARAHVATLLLKGTREHPAMLEQVSRCLNDAARRAKS